MNMRIGKKAMDQGEVWWADFPKPSGRRPVVILTRSHIIPRLSHITIAPCTTSIRKIRTHVVLTTKEGMPIDSAVNLDNIQTIEKEILSTKIVRLRHESLERIFAGIRAAFEMQD
jgi:mRNA interferase MazF